MNERPPVNPPGEEWETTVRETAQQFPYPQTPDIAAGVRAHLRPQRRRINPIWRVAAAILLILVILTLAVPEVRAVVLDFIQIGALRIFPVEPTTTRSPRTPTPGSSSFSEPTPLASALDMPGETTLEDARTKSGFDFVLPTYPADVGLPNHIYLQDYQDKLVTLVWTVPDHPDQVRLTLEIFDDRLLSSKFAPMDDSEFVRVNGQSTALWLPKPSLIIYFFERNRFILERDVSGSLLVWTNNGLTYRLESNLPKEEAIRVAESLR